MDIYTAEIAATKLHEFVSNISTTQHMYTPSIDRMKSISRLCAEISQSIDSLMSPTSITQVSETTPAVPKYNQSTYQLYKKIIKGSLHKTDITLAQRCASLIWVWFDNRFHLSLAADPTFRYKLSNIPDWIAAIVIVYAKHIQAGQPTQFELSFNQWCIDVLSKPCPYAVPAEVYQVYSSPGPDHFSLCSLVLWDILMSMGYDTICDAEFIYNSCLKHSPSILDNYARYQYDTRVLYQSKLEEDNCYESK